MKCLECKSEITEIEFLGKKIKYDENFCMKCIKKSNPIIKKVKPIKIELCFSCLAQKDKKGFVDNSKIKRLLKKIEKIEDINPKRITQDDEKELKTSKKIINDFFTKILEEKLVDQVELSNDYEVFEFFYELEPVDILLNKKNNRMISFNFNLSIKAMKRDLFEKFAKESGFDLNKMKNEDFDPKMIYKKMDKKSKKIFDSFIDEDQTQGQVSILYSICPKCKKLYGNYFESILKMRYKADKYRNINTKETYEKMVDFAKKVALKAGHRVVKEMNMENGVDLYFPDNQILDYIVKKVENEFGVKCVRSYTLYTEDKQTTRQVFRHTASIKAPLLIIGDYIEDLDEDRILLFVEQKNEYYKFIDLLKNREVKMENYENLNFVKLDIKDYIAKMNIMNINPVEVFNENTNEVISIKNPYKKIFTFEDSPIKIVEYNEEFYYVPFEKFKKSVIKSQNKTNKINKTNKTNKEDKETEESSKINN